jgi:hypothetical protein
MSTCPNECILLIEEIAKYQPRSVEHHHAIKEMFKAGCDRTDDFDCLDTIETVARISRRALPKMGNKVLGSDAKQGYGGR